MRILYFAWLREKIGTAEDNLDPPAEVITIRQLVTWLASRGPGYQSAFDNETIVRCAIDQEFAGPDAEFAGAKEIAFFPPVTGG